MGITLQQGLAFGLVAATVVGFLLGRWRYDLIALAALVTGLAIGVIPAEDAFDGFRNDVTMIIACALVVSAAFAKSGIVQFALQRLLPLLKTERSQVPVLTAVVTVLSMCTKNVGALAIMLPVAQQISRRTQTSLSRLLMPMSFGAMIGGLTTLVGTAPNIIVSESRQELLGKPFGMFDYTPVGLILTACALIFLSFAYRLLPDRMAGQTLDAALEGKTYLTEIAVPEDWRHGRMRLGELMGLAEGEVAVMGMMRAGKRRPTPHPNTVILPGDVLLVEGAQQALDDFVVRSRLHLTRRDRPVAMDGPTEEVRAVEAVIGANSPLIGASARTTNLYAAHGVNLLGVSRSGFRLTQHLRTVRLKAGDLLLLQGAELSLPAALQALDLLPLAEREVRLGGVRQRFTAAGVLAAAMIMVAFGVIPVSVAFFGAAVIIVALGGLKMREAYQALDGPLLVLIACLIPVSDAIQKTGGADLVAHLLSGAFGALPGVVAIGAVMLGSMAVTPFLNNAATVLIMAPIGASLAKTLGFNPDAFLMAVAVGAACDFLTPIGHQCNTLVMGPGGYKFADYPRLGAPLSLIVLLVAPPAIALFWPLGSAAQ
ncbi:SLC13 family permease [Phenylobacterium immobile]|uniref:SLC13 family permease n=1 Tax=Phenylobacterium immobile TaxID=21 RepID=UPI000A8A30B0|nr:SLC13 family permease [Phenylobacterium immobile]